MAPSLAAVGVGATEPPRQRCTWCGHVYDPQRGDPDHGIAPGTPFDVLPETWCCPDCRAPQSDFVEAGD